MKPIQTLLLTLFITLTMFTVVSYTACKKDPCRDVSCLNGGTCNDGVCKCKANYAGPRCEKDLCAKVNCLNDGACVSGQCQCAPGFEGDSCQVRIADRFAAPWAGISQCAPHQYDANSIQIDAVSATALLAKLPGSPANMTGHLTSSNTATLTKTVLTSTMTLDSANLTYMPQSDQLLADYFITVSQGATVYQLSCAATYNRQPKPHNGSQPPARSH